MRTEAAPHQKRMSLETAQRHIPVLIAARSRCQIPSTSLRNTLIANARVTVSVNAFSLKLRFPLHWQFCGAVGHHRAVA